MTDLIKEYSVSEIVKGIKNALEREYFYIKIKGEVSNFKKHPSGHFYFSLKDNDAMINIVMFKWFSEYCKIDLTNGLEIIVGGKLTIYKDRSSYQLLAETIQLSDAGSILKIIQERKDKLAKEGLFDISRKKIIPNLPKSAGIITAESGAALQDILSRLDNRTPIKLSLYSVLMQGKDAPQQIIDAINYYNKLNDTDKPEVIVITRGGGSTEDLMAFNDENLVRTVANSRIPVISAVGHEIDWTLIDYASDLRLPTPTSVAEYLTISKKEAYKNLNILSMRLVSVLLDNNRGKFSRLKRLFEKFILRKSGGYLKKLHYLELISLKIRHLIFFIFEKYKRHNFLLKSININKIIKLKLIKNQEKFNIFDLRIKNYANKYPIIRNYLGHIVKLKTEIISNENYILEFPDENIKIKIIKI